jgi:SAM-dependent methyltransferase
VIRSRSENIAALVSGVQHTEHKYLLHGPRHDPIVTPWMPYQPADFIGILWECMPEITYSVGTSPAFLDVGCGPGTKLDIAATLFGFDVHGIEIDRQMAAEAKHRFGVSKIRHEDAFMVSRGEYSMFDLIWLYRPLRDAISEARLEQHIIEHMKPGAILAGGSWETDVSALGWQTIVDDCLVSPDGSQQIIRGAWQKLKSSL